MAICLFTRQASVLACGFQEMNHPPYSPGLAASAYFLSKCLKKRLYGRHFLSDTDIKADGIMVE